MSNLRFDLDILDLANWINVVRSIDDIDQKNRLLDALYYGQLASKAWIINTVRPYILTDSSIFIFGGWVGILAAMFYTIEIPIEKIYNIDIDLWALNISRQINRRDNYFTDQQDMTEYSYPHDACSLLVINTITEHLTDEQYTRWYQNVPNGSLVVVQGNNLFQFQDHVRCSNSLEEFLTQNQVIDSIYSGELEFTNYKRFMAVWRKNELH